MNVHDKLANLLIGKAGLLSNTGPFSNILQFINNGIVNFLHTVIQVIPACREAAQKSLDESSHHFQHAIRLFANEAS